MLFNSYIFIFAFLPVVLLGFHLSSKYLSQTQVVVWLVITSLFFYCWWNVAYLALMVLSIGFNYAIARHLSAHYGMSSPCSEHAAASLIACKSNTDGAKHKEIFKKIKWNNLAKVSPDYL